MVKLSTDQIVALPFSVPHDQVNAGPPGAFEVALINMPCVMSGVVPHPPWRRFQQATLD